jgi:hypothetical protein
MTMRINNIKAILKAATLALAALVLTAGVSFAQQQVNLTAAPTTTTLPDGTTVPMWGYFCGTAVTTNTVPTATCAASNPASVSTVATIPSTWSPVVITVPTGQILQINLTNSLSFTPTGSTTPYQIPTSLVIVGQLGGGLGTPGTGCTSGATCTSSPDHTNAQPLTWPIAGTGPGVALAGVGTPPAQGNRVQSFATEVAAGTMGSLTFGTATNPLKPGTYLIESGTHPSIQGPMGLYGILVVTTAPSGTTAGTAYPAVAATATTAAVPAVTYSAEIPLLLSEIDAGQNNAVAKALTLPGFSETTVWSGQPGGCGNPATVNSGNCYPPAVNYTPMYYLFNGVAFNKTAAAATNPSLFPTLPATGLAAGQTVLVRFVNAGLRMHVPSIVGSQTGTAVAPATVPPSGFSLIAEDGNPLPGVPRVQSEVFLPAGKTYDVMINVPAAGSALPVFDRQLSLSGNATARDAGMLAYIGVNGAGLPSAPALGAAVAVNDSYASLVPCTAAPCPGLTVSDPGKGVIANDTNVYGVHLLAAPTGGTVTLNTDGTFTYVQTAGTTSDSFTYCANGSVTVTGTTATCSSGVTATVNLGAASVEAASGIIVGNKTYTSNLATALSIKPAGVLSTPWDACTPTAANPCHDRDLLGYPLTIATSAGNAPVASAGLTLAVDANGGFNASVPTCTTATGCSYNFTYHAQNSQGTVSGPATVTLNFLPASNLSVTVLDGKDKTTVITDYRWIIEEDRTFYVNSNCTTNSTTPIAGCAPPAGTSVPLTFGTNFHTSYMPVVATGCIGPTGAAVACEAGQTVYDGGVPCIGANNPVGCSPTAGQHVAAVCDVGNGVCRPGPQQAPVSASQVHLDPTKRYYLSVLPGDAGNPFANANLTADCINGVANATNPAACGHGMGGTPVKPTCTTTGTITSCVFNPVTVFVQPDPFPPSKLSVFVFEDDFPLNGEADGGGGTGPVNTNNEPGLGQFNITLFDDAGGTGDATGQMTYDMFNQPLVNSLAGTIDPLSGKDACPISAISRIGVNDPTQTGITGTIVTCPQFESDGSTPSPLAGQAVVANLMPGRYGVVATPGADRIGRGEEWLQTNTLDGQKAHDSFLRIGEPGSFQEYGPAGYHVSIGFANPKIINSRLAGVCAGTDPSLPPSPVPCGNTLTGVVTDTRLSRTPDERLYSSGDNSSFAFTQCYVSVGDADGEDFAFTKCNGDGSFSFSGLPDGDWRVTVFDQWNDMLVDGLSTPVRLGGGTTTNLGDIATNQWQANIYTKSFFDQNGNGIQDPTEPGLTLVPTNIRFRDGSYSNFNNTDLAGNAGFNEVFPLFSWYVVESDTARFKNTGTHVVYDAGGPADGSPSCGQTGYPVCGTSNIGNMLARTHEDVSVPTPLRVPGARYCASADCPAGDTAGGSTGRVDPPWVATEGWQGFSGQNSFIEFGKIPFAPNENGGIHGEVIYASTRPFDDPSLLIHTSWTPDVPGVTINLYKEGTAADNVTPTLTLVDHTTTSSWDDWAQGFNATSGMPNMSCPGQGGATGPNADLFYFTLFNQPEFLDVYNNQHNGTPLHTVPNNSQFKCYDGMHNWNQVQPATYDGMYKFPSVTGINPTTGRPAGTNCTICVANPDTTSAYWNGLPMLPAGKYVVEMVVPPGYELVKEEDKNILIGDNYIAPVTQEFPGLGSAIYILPDQAMIGAAYNANNAQNPTQNLGRPNYPQSEGDTGSVEVFWPCVGASRIVPDYISLFPQSHEVSPFAGATRNLCDRKEVTVENQMSALAKFWVFTSAHVAAHFTGVITDDYTSEFDPFSPQFGEKFSPPSLPVSIKDWTGTEISRVYTDQWGTYDGLTYSTWEVNPPNPTGYAPTMMVTCMNDPGPIPGPNGAMITDPLFDPQYSQFCYEIPFMPGQTQYMDTPVVPTTAFAGAGYNNVDCAYPDATPAISEVDSSNGIGPYVSAGGTLTITALGDQMVPNYAYAGPSATTAPYNLKAVKRHYGFGASQQNGTLAAGGVTIGGVNAPVSSWSDTTIVVRVPSGVPACPVQQQAQYGGSAAQCGELVITTGASRSGGNVTGVTITRGGSYNTAPTVTFGAAPAGGTTATGTAVLGGGGVASVTMTNGGTTSYTSAPTVSFTGGGGTAAAGTAVMRRRVTAVTITNNGGTYTTSPTVTFNLPGGGGGGRVRAIGTAVLTAGHVTSVNITNPGVYLTGDTITATFSGSTSTRATGNPVTFEYVSAVTITAPGSGYTTAPTVGFTGGGGSGAAGTAVLSPNRAVASVTITNAGSGYITAPTVTFSAGVSGGTTTALGTATINGASVIVSGRQSIDAVTVTIGGKAPTHVVPSASIQDAIDAAAPGDLIIVDPTCTTTTGAAAACTTPSATNLHSPAAHNEMLIMWKPVRLQGVGAATSIINANTHPAGKIHAWRAQIDCLFGLSLSGTPISGTNPYDSSNPTVSNCGSTNGTPWQYFQPYGAAGDFNPQVDRLPLEAAVGWDANLNGNLAELLQEPSLMGALEGAGITVLGKGVNFPSDPYDPTLLAGFPTGTTLLQPTVANPNGALCTSGTGGSNLFPSNYSCNPSSIDALGITDSSQGGGGVFVHGWAHNLQLANNRIYNNAGTLSGGINLGQGEYPPSYIQGAGVLNAPPGSCEDSPVPNAILPYCHNVNVNMHNNYISLNSSTGDELFSATPAGAGGVSICTGSDYYKFNYNWVCGNLTSGDGGGLGHLGFSYNGDIEHNSILFNQSTNPTIPANGGGIIVMGTPDADLVCNGNATVDQDCVPFGAPGGNSGNTALSAVSPSDGVGPGLVINANLIMGNSAESGSGAGIAFQAVNGTDMVSFPTDPNLWNTVTVTNNIIADNVGGWDGAGISLLDSTSVNIVNNTIVFNASTASAGPLLTTIGAPLASTPPPGPGAPGTPCTANCGVTSHPQPAGVVAIQNSAVLRANLPASVTVTCPTGHPNCRSVSTPKLENNIIWRNSSYYIGVGALSPQFQQSVVTLYNAFSTSQPASQATTGACPATASNYWDIGVRGDTGPTNHASGVTLAASDSVLTSGGSSVTGSGNSTGSPNLISSYCDGSRTPPETPAPAARGWQVPPGISDATVPNPIFNLSPAATVDEGNNWVNLRWGPLSMTNPTAIGGANGNFGGGLPLGNYGITSGSSAAGRVTGANFTDAPTYDFFNTPRKPGNSTDAGAVRLTSAGGGTEFTLSPSIVDFGLVPAHSPTTVDQDIQVINTGSAPLAFGNATINCSGVSTGCSVASFTIQSTSCTGTTLAAGQSCVINVVFNPVSTSQAQRNASLAVTMGGLTQTVALSGHDTIATITVSPITPALTTNPANATAKTGTITITNTSNPNTNPDAGPYLPTAITLTRNSGTGTFALGGSCAVATPINPGGTLVPPPAGSSCTITITYTPPVGATGGALNGNAHLTVTGYGTASTAPIINANYNAN